MMMPLLEGLDGVKKMSKSYGNYVAFNDPPNDMFGKLMSIPDVLMSKYYELLTDVPQVAIRAHLDSGHLRVAKGMLASNYNCTVPWRRKRAEKPAEEFDRVFSKGSMPVDIPTYRPSESPIRITDLMVEARSRAQQERSTAALRARRR